VRSSNEPWLRCRRLVSIRALTGCIDLADAVAADATAVWGSYELVQLDQEMAGKCRSWTHASPSAATTVRRV